MPSEAKTKHHVLKCRAGHVRRFVRVPKRAHGRVVRVHGRIVYKRVQRCVKVRKRRPTRKPSPPPRPQAPANTALPQVAGSTRAGQTLSAAPGAWTGTPTPALAYQWQRCDVGGGWCVNVPGATGSTYLLGAGYVGSVLRVIVTATNAAGSASVASALTAVIVPADDPVVVAVGDIACPSGDKDDSCKQSLTASVTAAQNPSAVLPLGDNQYDAGSLSEFTGTGAYGATWGVFNPIVHPVPGNHEYLTSGAAGYFQYFGNNGVMTRPPGGYYSFNVGTWHLIALNSDCSASGCSDSVAGVTSAAQLSWLQSDLAANRSSCVLAYWHHPLFSAGWIDDSPGVAPLWTALYNAHADIVLAGHDHLYERYAQQDPSGKATSGGIREFVVGTGGESLAKLDADPQSTLQASDDQNFGVLALTLHAASYDWKYITTNGTVIDSGSTACHGSGGGAATASAARDIATAAVARRILTGPPLVFDARPLRSSLPAALRRGLPVAIHCSRGCDVTVTASLRRGRRLQRIASFYETESQIPERYSRIWLRLPPARLRGLREARLVLRFSAVDAADHHRVVKRVVALRRA